MRKLFLSLALTLAIGGQAQEGTQQWALQEPTSGRTVLLTDVSFLLASDWQDSFSIVCKDGNVITGAETVNFVKAAASGIASATAPGSGPQVAICAAWRLTLTGCKPGTAIAIHDASGRMVASMTAAGWQASIDLGHLATGVYLLRAGETTVKFMKK